MILRRKHIQAMGASWMPFADAASEGLTLPSPSYHDLPEIDQALAGLLDVIEAEMKDGFADEEREFWKSRADFHHPVMGVDPAPFSVTPETPLGKVHFLFVMLGLMQIHVTIRGQLLGTISKNNFTKCFSFPSKGG